MNAFTKSISRTFLLSLLVLTAAASLAAAQDDNGAVNKDGLKKTITFMLTKGTTGWRIDDIDYGGGRTLVSEFKESR